jgi:hypothetical protein
MHRIQLDAHDGHAACRISNVSAFPGDHFSIACPEAIGDSSAPLWSRDLQTVWEKREHGILAATGGKAGQLSYKLTLTPSADAVKCEIELTNPGETTWPQGMAFNSFQCGSAPSIRDHDCARHWVRSGGEFKILWQIPRVFGPRPSVQLYSVEGAPPGRDIPFVKNFQATPDAVIEPWMAIVSRDSQRLVATVAKPGLFLFQNREYACMNCGLDFGEVKPGQTARAINVIHFVQARLEDWHARMMAEAD